MSFEVFRVGPGYVDMWMHATTHWDLVEGDREAVRDVGESMIRLVRQRTALEEGWRRGRGHASDSVGLRGTHRALLAATRDFFEAYYFALSSFGAFLGRFPELGSVPHVSDGEFLDFIVDRAPWAGPAVPTLRAAWRFATVLDPYLWREAYRCEFSEGEGRAPRIALHGRGEMPSGAAAAGPRDGPQGAGEPWEFVAPEVDLVVWSAAVQLNAFFPLLEQTRLRGGHVECEWEAALEPDEPRGYPLFDLSAPRGG